MNIETTSTMFISFVTHKGEIVTILVENLDQVTMIEDFEVGVAKLMFPISIESENIVVGSKFAGVCLLVSDDPTPQHATDLVSLGYYAFRIAAKDVVVTSINPLAFQIDNIAENIITPKIDINYTRQLRRIE